MKHAVITGASQGLGREMALYFAGRGWKVSGCGRNESRVSGLAGELGSGHGIAVVDVRDDSQVAAWAGSVLKKEGVPDLVINNAAVMARLAPVWELSAEEISQLMEINVEGTIHVIRHFLPAMIEKGTGIVVNFSSGWGRSTSPEVAAYCTSKWAIEGLTSALAQELPRGMAAVALNPGNHRHRNVALLLGRRCGFLPFGRGVDPSGWAVSGEAWASRQWPPTYGARRGDGLGGADDLNYCVAGD